ncbi:uncharacterized protein LOC117152293 [Bombus impatiens]|uniref:Uncharacterized protein LOC117152293 n=1 Tax=Bombus impatiens TaxID=132113 RepID=A0A6P8LK38_BOMIM|nr:uncharacterized protein LOC117152293 [Bombus impatiens]
MLGRECTRPSYDFRLGSSPFKCIVPFHLRCVARCDALGDQRYADKRGTRKRKCRAEHLSARAPELCQYGLTISNGSRSAQLGHKGALEELILVLSNGGATRGPASLVTIPGRSVEVTTTKEPERVQVSSPIHKHSREKKLVKTGLEGRSKDERGGWGRVAAGWNGASVFRIVMGEEKLTELSARVLVDVDDRCFYVLRSTFGELELRSWKPVS